MIARLYRRFRHLAVLAEQAPSSIERLQSRLGDLALTLDRVELAMVSMSERSSRIERDINGLRRLLLTLADRERVVTTLRFPAVEIAASVDGRDLDDASLEPVWEAAKIERPKTLFETDVEFNAGSKLEWNGLTKTQVANLAALGKVWGFLKYHHRLVAAGKRHWDYELFRLAPAVSLRWSDSSRPTRRCGPASGCWRSSATSSCITPLTRRRGSRNGGG